MAMLDRYKKKGGFLQLLILIETSGKQKQEQFLGLIAQENPLWEETLKSKALTLEKILSWNQVYLGEVLTRLQPLTLATALNGMPPEKVELILGCLSMSDKRKIQQVIDESKPNAGEISTCIMKIITETRGFIQGGILKLDKIDPNLVIPDNIEEALNTQSLNRALEDMNSPAGVTPEGETTLKFPSDAKAEGKNDHSKEEVDFLKKKVNQLVAENSSLKQEVALLRGRLDQIRKIA